MLGTYAAALFLIAASIPVGAAVLRIAGYREWAWIAPALGLALLTAIAWLAVRLPGEGLTALVVLAALALGAGAWALPRLAPSREELLGLGLPAGALALLMVSIPFIAEGQFGILGTGFNVDMSQHLFAAEWISNPLGPAPDLIQQGYPVGPHSLATATAELSGGNLVYGFTGITIAVPVIATLTALTATAKLGRGRGIVAALLAGLPYLVASYLAQGAFKELFEAGFLLAFALWLGCLRDADASARGLLVPGAVLAVGALYAYSGPGLVWLAGTLAIWAAIELARSGHEALAAARAALPAIAVAALVLVVLVAPEAGRVAEFGGSAGNVANSSDREPAAGSARATQLAATGDTAGLGRGEAARPGESEEGRLDLFDNDLGNLFGDIPALEAFGVWPSGDFRVEPGDGAIPAIVFYAGALLGVAAFAVGLLAVWRRAEWALLAALLAAVAIWLAAYLLSTPYTTAKALQMTAPLIALIAARGVLDPGFSPRPESDGSASGLRAVVGPALALAFTVAALGSSALALANAPVGPERYSAGISKLRDRLDRQPLLLLAPPGQLADRHGAAYYGWELRGGNPICVEPFPDAGRFPGPAPDGIRYVITIGGKKQAPFENLEEVIRRRRVTLWEDRRFDPASAPGIEIDENVPTSCELGLGG